MKIFSFLFILFLAVSCNTNSGAPAADVNLEGFKTENVPGTSHIRATRTGTNGELLEEGTLVNGKKSGIWIEYHDSKNENRIKTLSSYIDGKKNGVFLEFNTRGQIEAKTNYLADQIHGMKATYKFGRPLELTEYANGQLHGTHSVFYNRGDIQSETQFKNGLQDGYYRYYDEEGNMTMEYLYKNGEKVSGGMIEK